MRGNIVMKGYLKNPKATRRGLRRRLVPHRRPRRRRIPNGYIELKDRSKDIIISGGENISTIEVESVLYRHPAVHGSRRRRAARREMGRDAVRLRRAEGRAPRATPDEIIAFCRERLAHFKAPRTVVFGPLPKTSTGKIQKFVLREQAKAL